MPSLPPFAPPLDDTTPIRYITIRHPAYPDTEQPLLQLVAIDGGHDRRGLSHDFALVACGIVAGNNWQTGYLATKNGDQEFSAIKREANDILLESTYYYLLSNHDSSYKYPVTLSFQHYRFPHGNLPDFWARVQIPDHPTSISMKGKGAALVRDVTCRVTAYSSPLEVAHIVPYSEEKWFLSNNLTRYCAMPSMAKPTEDQKNLITLRKDQHHHFDHRHYTIVPCQDQGSTSFELRVLNPGLDTQLIPNYHTRTMQPITHIAPEFLHARLAWSIFSNTTFPFFNGSVEYKAAIFVTEEGKCQTVALRSFEVLAQAKIFEPPRSRSASPRKRKTGDAVDIFSSTSESGSRSKESDYSDDYSDSSDLLSSDSSFKNDSQEENRGRPIKRARYLDVRNHQPDVDAIVVFKGNAAVKGTLAY